MHRIMHISNSSVLAQSCARLGRSFRVTRLLPLLTLLNVIGFVCAAQAEQIADRVTKEVDTTQVQPLPNHFPLWANSANDLGAVQPESEINGITIVMARSPQQQAAFEQLLAEQQNPGSPNYHRWLTPEQIGKRFGISQSDIAAVTGWLQSQGLHVTYVSNSRLFIGFGGKAGDLGRAFQTEFHNYKVNGDQRVSVSSEPMIPRALAPVVKSVKGLYTAEEKPQLQSRVEHSPSPDMTLTPGSVYFMAPADFATIYDLPTSLTGSGMTIGIVGESRTDFADFTNFSALTGSTFPNPTEIVPTAYGGVDPGPAQTTTQTNPSANQGEATLDVTRAGSVAPGATIDLVVATPASGGIGADAEYLIDTVPVPVQVIDISFGSCESVALASGVDFWNTLFQTAAGEGISIFVSSGDSGASGCDTHNGPPPLTPLAISPNSICSSSYATCVGGTEFNDASNYSTYWSSTTSSTLGSALSYIPEGAWNEPIDANTSATQVASSGGGVSVYIPTPTWQTGTGVPGTAGRYTPDIAFSASGHDGYFACFAAGGGDCVNSGGGYRFEVFAGTSAAAPDMAGVAALLDQKLGSAQGNLNPRIYSMAATVPTAFHDVTVASSGVTGCVVTTPSMCNNSIPSPTTLTGGQSGFLINTGFDEVTGWGSLDVTQFVDNFAATGPQAPTATTGAATAITTTTATIAGTVNPNGAATSVWFLYGTISTLAGGTQTPTQAIGSGTTATAVTANLTGLTASTTYYFQAVAQNATGTTSGSIVSFTTAAPPAYSMAGTAVTIATPGATTGNTSTITVTPQSGFTAAVNLTCAFTTNAATDPATCSLSPASLTNFTGTTAQTSTLTVSTTAATTSLNQNRRFFWPTAGGTALALMLFFGIPARRRSWRAVLGMFALLFILASGAVACGGGGGGGGNGNPGTTAGTYSVTVTGTSGSITETTTINVTVQ